MSKVIQNRLRRVSGQINKIEEDIISEKSCEEIIPQFLAIKGALNAAFLAFIKESIDTCKKSDKETLEKLIAHLVKS